MRTLEEIGQPDNADAFTRAGPRREAAAHGLRAPRLQGRRSAGHDPAHAGRQGVPASSARGRVVRDGDQAPRGRQPREGPDPERRLLLGAASSRRSGSRSSCSCRSSRYRGSPAGRPSSWSSTRTTASSGPARTTSGPSARRVRAGRRARRLMPQSLVQKLVDGHLVDGRARARPRRSALRIDQVLLTGHERHDGVAAVRGHGLRPSQGARPSSRTRTTRV